MYDEKFIIKTIKNYKRIIDNAERNVHLHEDMKSYYLTIIKLYKERVIDLYNNLIEMKKEG